jgi:3-oxoacyl-[acyl-carrier-protein] synthase II
MTPTKRRRVVITGLGALTPLGNSPDEFWKHAVAAKSGIRPFQDLDASAYPCQVVGEVLDFEPTEYMDRRTARRMARFSQFAVATAKQALDASGLDLTAVDASRAGVVIGNGGGGYPNVEQAAFTMIERGGMKLDPLYVAKWLPNMAAANVTIQLGLHGYTSTVVTACASGTQAIGEAVEVIRSGRADVMFAGGTEAGICEFGLAGFSSMRALASSFNGEPERASRPFDRDRDGFVPGEGAGMLLLETLEHAEERGATPLAEVLGYGVSADAAYLVAPSDDGEGAALAMELALEDAGVAAEEIDYVSAHATATEIGDVVETTAIKRVLGERAYDTPVTSLKSQIGHLLGGSGGVETVAAVQTLLTGQIAPTVNLEHPGEGCDLDYVPLESRNVDVRTVMKNSFGFGGQNAVLILRRYEA